MNLPSLQEIKNDTKTTINNSNNAVDDGSGLEQQKIDKKKSKLHAKWLQKIIVPDVKCPDCRNGGEIIEDKKGGCVVCKQCGLVVEKQLMSEQSEWRTFAESDRSGPDPNRVGQAQHYLMSNIDDLSTTISKLDNNKMSLLQDSFNGNAAQRKLGSAISKIKTKCRQLGLPQDVQNSAGEIYKILLDCPDFKSKKDIIVIATCVYIGAKLCRCDRPLKELCEQFKVDRVSVRKIHSDIHRLKSSGKISFANVTTRKASDGSPNMSTAEVFAKDWSNKLKLSNEVRKYIAQITRNVNKILPGKNPSTIASCALYLATHTSKENKDLRTYKEISVITNTSESTIQTNFRKFLYSRRMSILPDDFGNILKIKNLPLK